MPIPMTEPEWNDAPTVYDLVVRGTRLPVVDMVHVENSFAARLAHRWTSMRTATRAMAMAIVDVVFSPATGDMRGIDPSVTRLVAEVSENYDLVLHLMLWDGRRIAIVRHTDDDAAQFATPRPYSLGVLNVEGTEWRWTDLLTKGGLLHLILWNGRRIAIVRHTDDDAKQFATPRPYSLGVLNVEGTEWRWTDLLTRGDLFARTRTDHPSMIDLGTYDAARLASSGRTRT